MDKIDMSKPQHSRMLDIEVPNVKHIDTKA